MQPTTGELQPTDGTARIHCSPVKHSEIQGGSTYHAVKQNSSTNIQDLNTLRHLKGYGLQNTLGFELNNRQN